MHKLIGWIGLAVGGIVVGIVSRSIYDSHREDLKKVVSAVEDRAKAVCHVALHGSNEVAK